MKRYSVIIPVLDETATINGLIARLNDLEGHEASEIIVVDGNPEGNTLKTIKDDRVRRLSSTPGRARQMNAGAA
ncbi:MAG: glycosyltransferase, partial [Syntrophales bacterium]|nr:glycosyltransferase [Syntrophales bacterium]